MRSLRRSAGAYGAVLAVGVLAGVLVAALAARRTMPAPAPDPEPATP